ncbi:MAG: RNA ligase family protein [Pseudomonadota bacterium]
MDIIKYPRTRHIEGSRLQAGDIADDKPIRELAGEPLIIEEKLDGANCAVSFGADGSLRLQSRGHYLTGGGRERHFDLLKTWAAAQAHLLQSVLGDRYIMYGEWLYAKHTVFYDRLPHYFMEFDVLDRETGRFLDTGARRDLLCGLPVMPVPVVRTGAIRSVDDMVGLVRPSLYKSEGWRDALQVAAEASRSRPDMVAQQTEDSDLAEGLYIKLEKDGEVVERYKYVRGDFLQAIQSADGHWLDRPILPNGLIEGTDIFAPELGSPGAYDDPSML